MQREAVAGLKEREGAAQEKGKQRRAEEIAAARARGKQFGTQQQEDAEAMARFREQTGLDPSMSASEFMGPIGAAISQRQKQGQQGGVDAAGNPVQVIGPATPMNALPAPSNRGDTAAGENERMDQMGNQFLTTTGTDTERAETVDIDNAMQPPQGQERLPNANVRAIDASVERLKELERRRQETQEMMGAGRQSTLFEPEE